MARRRNDDDGREMVSVFSLSFLDVFACALGALVLILLIIFNQVTLTFNPETVKSKIEAIEGKKENIVSEVREAVEIEKAARQWDATKDQIAAKLEKLEKELQEQQAAPAQYQTVTTETVEQAKQAVAQMQSQTVRQRESINNIWFGTGSVSQKARFVEVFEDYVIDHGQNPPQRIDERNIDDLVNTLSRARGLEYPLFVVHPDGIVFWRELEPRMELHGLIYGFEPYTTVWAPILDKDAAP